MKLLPIEFPVWFLLAAGLASDAGGQERFEFRQLHMGVETRIVLYAADADQATTAAARAFARVAELDSIMSDFRSDSELSRLVQAAGGEPVEISRELFHVLDHAQELARLSDGAFDVTAAPLVESWRKARRTGVLPSEEERRAAALLVGWRHLHLDGGTRSARLRFPGMRLDLGGIGKGYASDEAIASLRAAGIDRALVQMGGDIVVSGPPPGEKGWQIHLPGDEPEAALRLTNAAVSTSGDTEQYVEMDGVRYSHIVDPRTGFGLRSRVGVTVIADEGITADGLSTLLSVLGPGQAEAFAAEHFPDVRVYVRVGAE
jgi:FAD:protein FMN transferase